MEDPKLEKYFPLVTLFLSNLFAYTYNAKEYSGTWLFDLDSDPEERVNLADTEPQLLQTLKVSKST